MDRRNSFFARHRRVAIGCMLTATAIVGYGCFERSLKPVNPCTTSVQGTVIQVTNVDKVDLLLMIDNSNSMSEEQASVVTEVPRIVTVLTSGDRDGDGMQDFTPARSLHIGIVDSDMGLGDVTGIATCDPGFGDDGLMQIRARHPGTGCQADYSGTYPGNVFDFTVGSTSTTPAQFGTDVGCVAALGTDGCGFEFELEAPLKALSLTPLVSGDSPADWTHAGYRPPTFYAGTFGHGGDPTTNGAFLRPDSALAIVTINDEDDCSTGNPQIFSPDNPTYNTVDLNLRCHEWNSELFPMERYRDGFIGLRQNPALLIYGAITGVPTTVAGMDPAAILADPMMTEQVNPAMMNQLLPACISPGGRGVAYPAIRMTQLAQLLNAAGASTTVQSICNTNFSAAFDEIIRIVSAALQGACLARELNPDADGNVDCDVLEVLAPVGSTAPIQHCADLEHPEAYERLADEVTVDTMGNSTTREVCRVVQVGHAGANVDPGWAYDTATNPVAGWTSLPPGCGQRVGFSIVSPVNGAEVRLQCNETILPSSHTQAQLGTPCDPTTGNTTGTVSVSCGVGTAVPGNPMPLACDAFDRSCQIPCTSDANCTGAGLLSYVCDTRPASEIYGDSVPTGINPTDVHNFCVNPTCGQRAAQ